MDGLLVIDKPVGPTSHDVVARLRGVLGERRIGHTGTLDPSASGVLPLVVGRATRLARFLSASDKAYEAAIRFGVATDTYDAEGTPLGARHEGALPSRDAIEGALDAFRGSFLQRPPAYSAKKIGGRRSYKLAQARQRAWARDLPEGPAPPALPAPVSVTVHRLELLGIDRDSVMLRVDCSAGFYVRSLAYDLGDRLGTGAHLVALRRTRSGDLTLADAVALASAERHPDMAAAALVPLARMLPALTPLMLTDEGVRRAGHGQDLGPSDFSAGLPADESAPSPQAFRLPGAPGRCFRLIDPRGHLVGLAEPSETIGLLHPSVVLV
jgi:tRNA pseudouridine55 synthase